MSRDYYTLRQLCIDSKPLCIYILQMYVDHKSVLSLLISFFPKL